MSGRKNVLQPYLVVTNGDMTGNITSAAVKCQWLDSVSFEIAWTNGSSLNGGFDVQGSNTGNNWTSLGLTIQNASGASGSRLLDLQGLSFAQVRVVYTATAGSGTLNMWASGKQV